jgi:hypothetical protein
MCVTDLCRIRKKFREDHLQAFKTFHLYRVAMKNYKLLIIQWYDGPRGNVVGWGTVLEVEGRGFDFRWGQWIFQFFQRHYGPEVDPPSNRNEYQKYSGG